MNNMKGIDLYLIKKRLQGSNFKLLLIEKKTKKYRIARDCGISYRTLCNWQSGKTVPKDELALRVARYLGLIEPKEADLQEIKRDQKKIQEKIDRLSK